MENQTKQEDICCPKFEPALWDEKIITWENKKFITDKVCSFFYMPLNFGGVMTRLSNKTQKAGATMPDGLCLTYHKSKWSMDIYYAVDKDIPDAKNMTISGKYFCKVYEGNFKDTGKWCTDFEKIAKEKGHQIGKMFMWYTTCPKCAKKYGKNYVAILAEMIG